MYGRLTRLPCDPFLWGWGCLLSWFGQENGGWRGLEVSFWGFLCGLWKKYGKGYDNWKFFRYGMDFGWLKRERMTAGSFGGWIFTVWPIFLSSFISKVKKQSHVYSRDYAMLCSLDRFHLVALDQIYRLSTCCLKTPHSHHGGPVPSQKETVLEMERGRGSGGVRLWENGENGVGVCYELLKRKSLGILGYSKIA